MKLYPVNFSKYSLTRHKDYVSSPPKRYPPFKKPCERSENEVQSPMGASMILA